MHFVSLEIYKIMMDDHGTYFVKCNYRENCIYETH